MKIFKKNNSDEESIISSVSNDADIKLENLICDFDIEKQMTDFTFSQIKYYTS